MGRMIQAIVLLVLVLTISYFFEVSYLWSLLAVLALGLIDELIHLPENMPGKRDNLEGESAHPYKVISFALVLIISVVLLANYFPVLQTFGSK